MGGHVRKDQHGLRWVELGDDGGSSRRLSSLDGRLGQSCFSPLDLARLDPSRGELGRHLLGEDLVILLVGHDDLILGEGRRFDFGRSQRLFLGRRLLLLGPHGGRFHGLAVRRQHPKDRPQVVDTFSPFPGDDLEGPHALAKDGHLDAQPIDLGRSGEHDPRLVGICHDVRPQPGGDQVIHRDLPGAVGVLECMFELPRLVAPADRSASDPTNLGCFGDRKSQLLPALPRGLFQGRTSLGRFGGRPLSSCFRHRAGKLRACSGHIAIER
jgi:hypothetical protein